MVVAWLVSRDSCDPGTVAHQAPLPIGFPRQEYWSGLLFHPPGDPPDPGIESPTKRKAKWLSEEALQVAVKRREAKGKGEKERDTHLNAEFQRTAGRDKKAFLSNQCKEIEENNRMGKTRDLFKKISDTKGTFHAKMQKIKDRNGMGLTKAEDIKKR